MKRRQSLAGKPLRLRVRSLRKQVLLYEALSNYRPENETPAESQAITEMLNELEEIIEGRRETDRAQFGAWTRYRGGKR